VIFVQFLFRNKNQYLTDLSGLHPSHTIHSMYLSHNGSLTSLHGIDSVTSFTHGLGMTENINLSNLEALGQVTSIGGDLTIGLLLQFNRRTATVRRESPWEMPHRCQRAVSRNLHHESQIVICQFFLSENDKTVNGQLHQLALYRHYSGMITRAETPSSSIKKAGFTFNF
jgi:hypothetical protein